MSEIKTRTMEEAFYLQTKAFLEKNSEHIAEIARLKAEFERLNRPAIIGGYNLSQYIRMANSETLEFDNGDMFADMTLPERIKYIVESHARLKAEVERLTKAGDEVIRQWSSGDEKDAQNFLKALVIWNAAKEGKGQP
jgi:uncharacterized small protein (DUF1192 family)